MKGDIFMKKRVVKSFTAIVLVLCMLSSLFITAFASDEERDDSATRFTGIFDCYAGLSISDWGKASCSSFADCKMGYSATITMELKRDTTTIKTWTASGTSIVSLSKTYYVMSGYTYQVVATIVVKDSHGVVVDTIERSSFSVTF